MRRLLALERLEDRATPAVTAVGAEFRFNQYTVSVQNAPAVAIEPDGDFVTVWHSEGQDGSGYGVYARRYNAAGTAQGAEFRIPQYTSGPQRDPAVAMDANGNFVVAWISYQEGSGQGIYARRYDSAGTPLGDEFLINTTTSGSQLYPSVAVDPDGEFVVVWGSIDEDPVAFFEIYGQRFNAAGVPQGSEFHVNQFTNGTQYLPVVGAAADGSFVVTWVSQVAGYDIYARRYSAAGVPLGDEFAVNQEVFDSQSMPAIAVHADGSFVIAWESNGQDGSLFGVYARRFDATGAPLGNEFRPYNVTVGNQFEASLSATAGGGFIVTFTSYAPLPEIFLREYAANGQPVASQEVRVNTHTTNAQMRSDVAADASGHAIVVWQSGLQDGSEWGVYGQRFAAPARVTGVRVSDGSAQRSRISELTVTFNAQVTFAGPIANAFTLTRTGGGAVGFSASASTVGGVSVVTLNGFTGAETEFGSLKDGRYTLIALGNQISSSGLALDGDGNGTAGGNFSFGDAHGLFRFYGDMNGDRRVDITDFGYFSLVYLTPANYNSALDFNNDGRIDIADFGQFSVRYFTSLP